MFKKRKKAGSYKMSLFKKKFPNQKKNEYSYKQI